MYSIRGESGMSANLYILKLSHLTHLLMLPAKSYAPPANISPRQLTPTNGQQMFF